MFLRRFMENARNEREADDASDEDAENSNVWCHNLLLKPENKKRIYLECLISIICLCDLFYNVFTLFVKSEEMLFNYIIIPFYLGGMYVSCVSSFYKDIKLIKDFKIIIKRYIKSTFLIDFLGTVPFFIFGRWLLSLRLLRIFRFGSYIDKILTAVNTLAAEYVANNKDLFMRIHKMSRFNISFAFIVHLIACLWIWIGRFDDVDGWVNRKSSILDNKDSSKTLYIASIYWVITTFATVGYGDFVGYTNFEYIFQMFTMFIGIGFFGYIIGNISVNMTNDVSIHALYDIEEEERNIWQMNLGRAYKDKDLSFDYVQHMNSFFEQYWNLDFCKLKENEFFSKLKPKLQNELSDLCYKCVYDKFYGFFNNSENGFKREMVNNLVFQEFRIFPPYTDTYKDDKRSFPSRQSNVLLRK